MARTTPRQGNKPTKEIRGPGYSFIGFEETRDPETGKLSDKGIKITFQKYTESWLVSDPESATVGPDRSKERRSFDYYRVRHRTKKGVEIIGQITAHTTEARLESMIYRYFHPGHATPCTFGPDWQHPETDGEREIRVCGFERNKAESEGRETSRKPFFMYVPVPKSLVDSNDYRVDDEARFTIWNEDGEQFTFEYHLSLRSHTDGNPSDSGSLVIPLSPIRKAVYYKEGDRTVFRHITEGEYRRHTEQLSRGEPIFIERVYQPRATKAEKEAHGKGWKPEKVRERIQVKRFIGMGERVTVCIEPEEFTDNFYTQGTKKTPIVGRPGRFDFAKESLTVIARAQLRAKNWSGPEDE